MRQEKGIRECMEGVVRERGKEGIMWIHQEFFLSNPALALLRVNSLTLRSRRRRKGPPRC